MASEILIGRWRDMPATVVAISGPVVIQVRERGQLTIPAEMRRQAGIREGDVFSLIWVEDTLIATRKQLVVPEIAKTIEALMQEQGVTLDDLLEDLERQREIYVRERYGIQA